MSHIPSSPALHCVRCDAALPASFKPGLCAVCLMDVAMQQPTQEDTLPAAAPKPALSAAELAPHFPQLEILECIGRGGMGVVYKARQKALDRLVALKLLAPEQTQDAAFATRFAHEARALAALSHPNIVTVHDFGESGGFYFLLMEFVDGVNLRQAMHGSLFTPEQALAIVPPICEALQYAHDCGIVHRDIKPENLLLDKSGRVKIADFGIAKIMRHSGVAAPATPAEGAPPASATAMAGTPAYMAPEQRSSATAARTDHRADIYSLGVVLYELLTGELPSRRLDAAPMADTRLDEIVRRALAQDPAQRYQTIEELRSSLATLTAVPSAPGGADTASHGRVWPRSQPVRWLTRVLQTLGVTGLLVALGRLLLPAIHLSKGTFDVTVLTSFAQKGLAGTFLLAAAAGGILILRHKLARASYRPLLVPPSRMAEVGGFVARLAGLGLVCMAIYELMGLRAEYSWGQMASYGMLWGLGAALFLYEHTLTPILHAVPVWRPLPFAGPALSEKERRMCGHAVAGGVLLGLLVWIAVSLGERQMQALSESATDNGELAAMPWSVMNFLWASAIVTLVGWTAVARIRRSAGRLRGLVPAVGAAAALPLSGLFVALTYLVYVPAVQRAGTTAYQPDGEVRTQVLQRPELLAQIMAGAGGLCLLLWLVAWLAVRKAPAPLPAARPAQRLGMPLVLVWSLGILGSGYLLRYSAPSRVIRVPIPAEHFPRYVEREVNLRLFVKGFTHEQSQGTLLLPDHAARSMGLRITGLRNPQGQPFQEGIQAVWIPFKGRDEMLRINGYGELKDKVNLLAHTRPYPPLRQEIVLPSPLADDRCVWNPIFREPRSIPDALHEKLSSPDAIFTEEDRAALAKAGVALVLDPAEEGALRLFGGAALVTDNAAPDFNWLSLDDRAVAAALVKARDAAQQGGQNFTLVRAQAPAVVAFVTWGKHCGLLQNLGPTRPGARNARLRTAWLGNPFR